MMQNDATQLSSGNACSESATMQLGLVSLRAYSPASTCSNARTAAAGSSLPQIAWHTAMKSAPAATKGLALSGVIPPIATQGISNKVAHQLRIAGSGRCSLGLVRVG